MLFRSYTTEIVVDMQGTMQLLGGRPHGDQQNQGGGNNYQQPQHSAPRQQAQRPAPQQQQQQSRPAPQQQAPQPAPDFDSFDDDIPF